MRCPLCEEEIERGDHLAPVVFPLHRECGLREVVGGIGHLIDHQHYCIEKGDPDAGMSYRDSARMVVTWIEIKGGVDKVFDDE